MNAKAVIVIGFLLAVGAIFFFQWKNKQQTWPSGSLQSGASVKGSKDAVEISFLYSTEKKEWIEASTSAFTKEHPDISVKLLGKGSLDAAQALVDGKEKPILWSPADSLVLNLGGADYETKTGARLFAPEGSEDAPQALVITPLVFVVWEDRAQVLLKAGKGQINWKLLRDAVSSNQGWSAIGGNPDWGFVKLGAYGSDPIEFWVECAALDDAGVLQEDRRPSGGGPAKARVPGVYSRHRERSNWVRSLDRNVHDRHDPIRPLEI